MSQPAQLPRTPSSIAEAQKLQTQVRVQREFDTAKASGHRFAYIAAKYDEDFCHFIEAVTLVVNASNPPPHALAPYYGESRGRDPHSVKISSGVLITF